MKKFFLLIAIVLVSLGASAQKGKVTAALSYIDQGVLDKAKESLDQALNDEKSKVWFNTYFAKGKLCLAVFEANNEKYNSYYADPLSEAYSSFKKAIELDPKGTVKKRIITGLLYNNLAIDLFNQGSKRFEVADFEGALTSFKTQIEITEGDMYASGSIDTGMYYNAGLTAINAKKYTEAIAYFEKCAEMKYLDVKPHFQLYACFLGQGDTAKAEAYLLDLPNKFPGDKDVTLNLIDLYIKSNRLDDALKYIGVAKEADPGNYSLYYAAGIMFLNQEKFDESIAELSKAVELKPDNFDNQYGLGVAYNNKASDMFKKANDIMDIKEYNKAIEVATSEFSKALPYLEKALELKPDDLYTMQSLRELYYRLKSMDKYNAIKARIEALENK